MGLIIGNLNLIPGKKILHGLDRWVDSTGCSRLLEDL